jgi:hypothetical protein
MNEVLSRGQHCIRSGPLQRNINAALWPSTGLQSKVIFVPFLFMSTSLKNAPYVSCVFFFTDVPNFSNSSGTG